MDNKIKKCVYVLFASCPLYGLIGCSGLEVGGKLGVYRVDTHSEQSVTLKKPLPLKCFFTTCEEAQQQGEGS